jgi:hypothetical protein
MLSSSRGIKHTKFVRRLTAKQQLLIQVQDTGDIDERLDVAAEVVEVHMLRVPMDRIRSIRFGLIVEAFGDYAPDFDWFARRFAVDRYATRSRVKSDRNCNFAHVLPPVRKAATMRAPPAVVKADLARDRRLCRSKPV